MLKKEKGGILSLFIFYGQVILLMRWQKPECMLHSTERASVFTLLFNNSFDNIAFYCTIGKRLWGLALLNSPIQYNMMIRGSSLFQGPKCERLGYCIDLINLSNFDFYSKKYMSCITKDYKPIMGPYV